MEVLGTRTYLNIYISSYARTIMQFGILGGGIAGLTLSQFLGRESIVLEKEDKIGGLARSIQFGDYIFDQGSHIIFSRDTEVLEWMVSQLGSNINQNIRDTRIYLKGDLVGYPFENDLKSLPKDIRYDCVMGYVNALINQKDNPSTPDNFREWIYQTFGKGIAEHYMIPYNKKVWCLEPQHMSSHWMEGRVPMPPAEDIIKSSMGIKTEGYTHQSTFYYPETGGIEAFAQSIAENSEGKIHTSEEVISVTRNQDNWVVTTDKAEYQFSHLFNTLPIYLLPKLMDIPTSIETAISNLRSTGARLVMIGIDGPTKPYSWMYFPDEELYFNRISFPKNFSQFTSPAGKHSILVEVTCNVGDKIWKMNDEQFKTEILEQLISIGMIETTDDVELLETVKTPLAYVVYDTDYLDNISTIRDYCEEIGLINVGRFAEFLYYNMDGVIGSAMEKSKPFRVEETKVMI